jgi:thymidine kinase
MAISEYVTKVHAVCKKSGNVANYSFRKNKKKDIVVIGEKDKYEPLSRAIFF